jgi:hypothetical protein
MRCSRFALVAMFVLCGAMAASGQTSAAALSQLETAAACAPPPTYDDAPDNALRIIGSQDVLPRSLFGNRDLLVLGGGTSAGVQLGQQYFVRRTIHFGSSQRGRGAKTLGWVRVVAVNESTAIATVDHVCGGIVRTDYLAPFVAPVLPAAADRDDTSGEPDFTTLGHIVVGDEDRTTVGAGDFVLIDWGSQQGLTAGARFAIYRDVGVDGLPLASVGEGVVISTGSAMSLTRITRTRDAVFSGDYVALRK